LKSGIDFNIFVKLNEFYGIFKELKPIFHFQFALTAISLAIKIKKLAVKHLVCATQRRQTFKCLEITVACSVRTQYGKR
jgi:hypothetical protein